MCHCRTNHVLRTPQAHDVLVWIGQGATCQQVRLVQVLYHGTWRRYLTNELNPQPILNHPRGDERKMTSVPSRNWRLQARRYRLVGERCERCGTFIFPPRDICPECEAPAKTIFAFSGRGEVYSYSTLYSPPAGFERTAPYTVALVRLEEGPLITAQLTDMAAEEMTIGMSVEMVTRRIREDGEDGAIVYGYKFRLVRKG